VDNITLKIKNCMRTKSPWPLPFRSSDQIFFRISHLSHACKMPRPKIYMGSASGRVSLYCKPCRADKFPALLHLRTGVLRLASLIS